MEDDPLFERPVIDVGPRKRKMWLLILAAIAVVIFLFGSQILKIYIDSLWFASVGYESVYWYKFRLGGLLFLIFFALTFLIIRLPFVALNRLLPQLTERPRVRISSVEDLREINFLPLIYRPGVWLLAAAVAFLSAINMAQEWPEFALYLNASEGGVRDPIFGKDTSFYLFKLPVLELISGWLLTLAVILFVVVAAASAYVSYIERARGFAPADVSRRAATATSGAAAFFAVALAFSTWLDRYDLLHTQHEIFTGVSYTDAHVRLPALVVLAAVLVLAALALVLNAAVMRRSKIIVWLAAAVVLVWALGTLIIPQSVYSFSVKPNELAKEAPFIQHNIEMTRRAFALDRFEERPFQPAPTLTARQIQENLQTVENIRLWDPAVLQSTLKQLQVIRTYYDFRVPDVDRYVVNGRLRQVMLAAREMNVDQLPEQSRNWINQHLVYTHGYGVAMNTVNEFTAEGQPHLVLRDMPVVSDAPEIKITRPEIYFGEVTNSHVYVHTRPQGATQPEFNYPAPEGTDSYTEYEGKRGIQVGGAFRQMALSLYLGDSTNLLFSDYINSESRVLIHRNVLGRVQQIAPFLMFERDPYLVISREGKLFWIIDGFTYSDRYPYSTAYPAVRTRVNYIRNSVKAVVDAYEGDVNFYVFDADDPIINSYRSIFPSLFHADSEMAEDLREHVRYPDLLAETQAHAYALYHIQNPQTFYNHEDLWAVATVEAAAQAGAQPSAMQPYYVLMQLPAEQKAALEFVNILPFTPSGPGRNNMIGWMAARSDGEHYGQTLVFSFPKNLTVNGPAQIRARVNQDSELSKQMTLWNQMGTRLLRGNLLVIPVADSLLYIEPFFLQAENSPLPELRQVAVATQDRLATGKAFDEALHALFPDLPAPKPSAPAEAGAQPATARGEAGGGQPSAPSQPQPQQPGAAVGDLDRLARQAQQLLSDYERLTAEGRHREAGEKLDQLKQALAELNRRPNR